MISRVSKASILQGFVKSRSFLAGNSAYIPTSFESIATATGTGSSGTITFSSIPSTFKHLQVRGINNDGSGFDIQLRFNSDSGSNYAYHYLEGYGSGVSAAGAATQTKIIIGSSGFGTNIMGASVIDVLDYANTSKYKTVRTLIGNDRNGGGSIMLSSGLWQSTSAISSLSLINDAGANFTSSTTFALYGIKEA